MQRLYRLLVVLLVLLLAACGADAPAVPAGQNGGQPSQPTTAAGGQQPQSTATGGQAGQAEPTATAQPTVSAPADATPQDAGQPLQRSIELSAPQANQQVSGSVEVAGSVTVTPFEANLVGQVYDANGTLLGEAPITVNGEMGQPGTFSGQIPFRAPQSERGVVQVAEFSANDGSLVVSARVDVTFAPDQGSQAIEIPAPGAQLVLPLHYLARVDRQPGEMVEVAVRWQNGVELSQPAVVLEGEDGGGLLLGNLNWQTESEPPQPAEHQATFEIRDQSGEVLASQPIEVLRWDDPATTEVKLFWVLGEELEQATRRIPKTQGVGSAALEELLWGPDPGNLAGFETAIPGPQEVLESPQRQPDWGPRVRLLGLTITDGVATANFSQELAAYGGGSLRVTLIREQISWTLLQFPAVQEVRIAIEGQTEGVLEP